VLIVIALPIHLYWLFIVILIGLIALAMSSKIPMFFLLKRLLLLEPFVICIAILALFQENGGIVFASIVIRSTLSLLTILAAYEHNAVCRGAAGSQEISFLSALCHRPCTDVSVPIRPHR
jgi:hypothetical protein